MHGDNDESGQDETNSAPFFIASEHRPLRRVSAVDEDSRRPPPTISVTREIEQTLSRPPAIRDSSDEPDPNGTEVPPPASETMC